MKVDLNSDLGEEAGQDDEILSLVSSANIACGFHAGNPASILNSIRAAKEKGVAVGAHPSLDDRKNFGRTEMQVSAAEVYALVAYQVGAFNALCTAAGVEMNHVKPHGALYNMAVRDRELSDEIAHGVFAVDTRAILFAPAGTELFRAARNWDCQPRPKFSRTATITATARSFPERSRRRCCMIQRRRLSGLCEC